MSVQDPNNLLDPRNPKSPYNRYNWNSPFSFENPLSSNYNRNDAAITFLASVMIVGFLVVVIGTKFLVLSHPELVLPVCIALVVPFFLRFVYINFFRGLDKHPLHDKDASDRWVIFHGVPIAVGIFLVGFEILSWFYLGGSGIVFLWETVVYFTT